MLDNESKAYSEIVTLAFKEINVAQDAIFKAALFMVASHEARHCADSAREHGFYELADEFMYRAGDLEAEAKKPVDFKNPESNLKEKSDA